jgi:hypothetical protein
MEISGNDRNRCQMFSLERLAEPGDDAELYKLPLRNRLRLVLRRSFSPSVKRKVKKYSSSFVSWFSKFTGKKKVPTSNVTDMTPIKFKSGEAVQIRSKDHIQLTLNYWNELKGCGFLPEMWKYCGTEQKVLKPVNRFVDEVEARVKKARGVYILEGLTCEGTELYGKCDRNCFYFWREEWLIKLDESGEENKSNG